MIQIIPSILTNSIVELQEKLQALEGIVDRVHIDIIDGKYANNLTIMPENLGGLDTNLKIDFHLMVENPIEWVERCGQAGADRIIAQIEQMTSQTEYLGKVTQMGLGAGLAIDVQTSVDSIEKEILKDLDVVLVMSVEAGFGGQKFEPRSVQKIKKLATIKNHDNTPFRICADGGETTDTIDDVTRAGVDEVVIGKRIFDGVIEQNIRVFLRASENDY